MHTSPYFLRPHVFLSLTSRYVVILDVQRNRYVCVLRKQFDRLIPWLSGWPVEHGANTVQPRSLLTAAAAEIASQFVSEGILTLDSEHSKPVCPVSIPAPQTRGISGDRPPWASLLLDTPTFLLACRQADTALKRQPFSSIVQNVEARRRKNGTDSVAPNARALRLVCVFEILRPLYPRPYLCTFDSLALLDFLAFHGLYPRWVFAVCADPFSAHCWVQHGNILLNDRVEHVSRLVPIMAV